MISRIIISLKQIRFKDITCSSDTTEFIKLNKETFQQYAFFEANKKVNVNMYQAHDIVMEDIIKQLL